MQGLMNLPGAVSDAWSDAMMQMAFGGDLRGLPELAATPRDTVLTDGCASLYRFRAAGAARAAPMPLLLVPSMINRWYVLDLRKGFSFAEALNAAGIDTWCLDWGIARDEDRYFTWNDVIARLARMVRRVKRETGAPKVGLLGYCMGATLASIYTALEPDSVAALVNLAGPIDFSHAGFLGHMVDARWFDPSAIVAAGNVAPTQMQSGFSAMRPTLSVSKIVGQIDRYGQPGARESFHALETWGNDNIPFPGAAYETYIRELYQQNLLVKGEHRVGGRRVDLANIRCPVLAIGSEKDTICPLPAARALLDRSGSQDRELLTVTGGHVGAVVGTKASQHLYPSTAKWLIPRLGGTASVG